MGNLLQLIRYKDLNNWSVLHQMANTFNYKQHFKLVRIGDFIYRNKTVINIEDEVEYKRVKIKLYNKGVSLRNKAFGKDIGTKRQFLVKEGQFLLSKIDARNGAFGIATPEVNNAIITADFFAFDIDKTKIDSTFLVLLTTTNKFLEFAQGSSSGTTGRQRISEKEFLNVKIPLPSLEEQKRIVKIYKEKNDKSIKSKLKVKKISKDIEDYIFNVLGIEKPQVEKKKKILQFTRYKNIREWSYGRIINDNNFTSNIFESANLNDNTDLSFNIFRGKSPKYSKSKAIILNQKCNRWNSIELEHAKTVNESWLECIAKDFFTRENDVIINSTGDGTIGRASVVRNGSEGLLFDSHILLLRPNQDLLNSEYFTELFNSSYGQSQVEYIKSAQSTKQTELGINNLKRIKFPLPSLDVQNEIAETIIDKKSIITHNKILAEQLQKESIEDFENEIFM